MGLYRGFFLRSLLGSGVPGLAEVHPGLTHGFAHGLPLSPLARHAWHRGELNMKGRGKRGCGGSVGSGV